MINLSDKKAAGRLLGMSPDAPYVGAYLKARREARRIFNQKGKEAALVEGRELNPYWPGKRRMFYDAWQRGIIDEMKR